MVLRARFVPLLLLGLSSVGLGAEEPPRPAQVTLPLADYLTLVEDAEREARERTRQAALREAPVAEVVAQRTAVVVGEKEAEVASEFEVLVQGRPQSPLLLPFAGFAADVKVEPAGPGAAVAVTAARGGGLQLIAPAAGRYTVKATGRAALQNRGGVSRFELAPVLAPVATSEVELPADLAWSAPGAVVVEEREAAGRRRVRLASRRGEAQAVEVRRRLESGEAGKLLAQSVVLTIVQLLPDGARRHDVVLYEVERGGLASLTVDLPSGLAVETAGTDEGDVVPVVESRRLTVHRRNQLTDTGYLVLTSSPQGAGSLPLAGVMPETEVRSRYAAVSSTVAAEVRPQPEASWARVDLDDLPPLLREALASLDLTAAWRLSQTSTPGEGLALAVSALPTAPSLPSVVRLRETTTLLTVDGTVLHREQLTLDPSSGPGTALEIELAEQAVLWSAQVDGQPVRPLARGRRVAVPLGFGKEGRSSVEVIAVVERSIPPGRSQLALDLPQVAVPVLEHRWRVLLPEGPSYRFRAGDLRPTDERIPRARDPWTVLQKVPGVLRDRVNVGGNESAQQPAAVPEPAPPPPPPPAVAERREDTGATVSQDELEEIPTVQDSRAVLQELQQGLVGGIKPLPVTIPEDGKVLLLTGVLPPARVAVELDVRAKR